MQKRKDFYICNLLFFSNLARAEAYAEDYYQRTKIILGIEKASVIFNKQNQYYEEVQSWV